MDRRAVVLVLALALATAAGCGTTGSSDGCEGSYVPEFYVSGDPVGRAPENATVVPATDDRIDHVEPIQRVIRLTVESGNDTRTRVNRTEFERVRVALNRTPLYAETSVIRLPSGIDNSTVTVSASKYVNPKGLYVESRGAVVRVSYQSWCSGR